MAILIFRSGVTLSDLGEDIINYHFARSKVKTPVILYFKYHGNMDITIKIHKGKSINLSVNATDSIKFIKLMIQDQENYHKDVQKLYLTIENNLQIRTFNTKGMWGLGTPEDLSYYLENYKE